MIPVNPQALNSTEYSRVCSVICAYRLVDVLAMLGGNHAANVERGFFQVAPAKFRVSLFRSISHCLTSLQGIDKLASWPNVLFNFRNILSKATKRVSLLPEPQDRSAAYRLLRLIARNNNTKSYASIEANLLFAAMHIACMKDLSFPDDVCPDLPDDVSCLVRT